jgi:hypothetical protein
LHNNRISNLVSELFNQVNSKESSNYISDLLINSLSEYKKKYPIESVCENKGPSLNLIKNNEIKRSEYKSNNSKKEYLAISNDIHSILSNCSELTNSQKLDFCTNQRYFMKLYLKQVIIKLNKA